MTQSKIRVDRDKLSDALHFFLYHNEELKDKMEGNMIVVPRDEWLNFLHDMGIIIGFYINASSEMQP